MIRAFDPTYPRRLKIAQARKEVSTMEENAKKETETTEVKDTSPTGAEKTTTETRETEPTKGAEK